MKRKLVIKIKQTVRGILMSLPMMLPALARADGFPGGDGSGFILTDVLQKLSSYLSGPFGGVVAVLGCMFIGYLWIFAGRLPKERAFAWIGGISFIFGANWLYQYFWGSH